MDVFTVDPGAKERSVQILGPNEANIEDAKALISETIQRNRSPDPGGVDVDEFGGGDRIKHYSFTVDIGENEHGCLKVYGNNHELVKTAKLVLDDFFAKQPKRVEVNNNLAGGDVSKPETKSKSRPQMYCLNVWGFCLNMF